MALCLVLSACATGTKEPSKEERLGDLHLRAGRIDISEGNFPSAIQSLRQAVKLLPNNPEAWEALGLAYYGRRDYKAAEASLRKAIAINPNFTQARLNFGAFLLDRGKLEEARKELEFTVRDSAFEQQDRSFFNLAQLELKVGNSKAAEAFLKRATEENSSNCNAWLALAKLQSKQNRTIDAVESYRRATGGICYGNIQAHFEFAALMKRAKEFDTARKKYAEIIEKFPETRWSLQAKEQLRSLPIQQ